MNPVVEHPFYFGPPERSLFGCLHEAQSPGHLGVVICRPFGYESVCTHHTIRHLASGIAAAGYPVLRFDYDGCGDSTGTDLDPDRMDAWVRSVHESIDALKVRAGVTRVCLVGLRLGAMLATLASETRSDVAALIPIAPVVRGRTYLRELRALTLSRPQELALPASDPTPRLLEAGGFVMTEQTQTALGDIDLAARATFCASQVLLLDRDDLPNNASWPDQLRKNGTTVEQQTFTGYTDMSTSAHESIVPPTLVHVVTTWLNTIAPKMSPEQVAPRQLWRTRQELEGSLAESIVFPDPTIGLVGILAEPLTIENPVQDAFLLLNAGAISRIGPGRLYVSIARRLANRGAAVLRLDMSGIGDSLPRPGEPDNVVYSAQAPADVDAALTFLRQRYGTARMHVVGLCSGAYHGFKAAVAGTQLDTVAAINPLTFFWEEGMLMTQPDFIVTAVSARYQSNAVRLTAWLRLLRGDVNLYVMARTFMLRALGLTRDFLREIARRVHIPVSNDLASELRRATSGGTRLYFLFGSSDPGLQLLQEQGGSQVRRLMRQGSLKAFIIKGADHTFTARSTRMELIEILAERLYRREN